MLNKERFRALRKRFGSREKLSAAIGVSEPTIKSWENQENASPNLGGLVKAAAALGTTVAYLIGETDDPSPDRFQKLREEFSDVDSEKVEKVINTPSQGYVLDRLVPEGMTDEELEDVIKRNEILVKRLELEYLRREQEKRKK